jgi:hypothetical protein
MNPTITAEIANQRHAQFIADAVDYRRSRAARMPRPARRNGVRRGHERTTRRPLNAFHAWLAAGQL